MALNTKNRKDLKFYFVKNAIPTEGNFADLVDAQLNQSDDGVFKLAGEPLSVVASPGDQKRVLRLYASYPAANPDWLISLNPAQDPASAATNRAGFGVADGAGNTRLFINAAGSLGLGTNEPQGAVDVRIGGSANAWHRFVVTTSNGWGDANSQHVTIGTGGSAGIMFSNPHVAWHVGESRASIRYGRTGGTAGKTYWDVGVRVDGAFTLNAIDDGAAGADLLRVTKAGNVGIRTNDPQGALDVRLPAGASAWNRFVVNTTTAWGEGNTQYVTIGAGGATGIMLSNPHVPWYAPETRASIRYGRSGGVAQGAYWDAGARAGNGFSFALNGGTDHKLWLDANGNIGIGTGTAPPSNRLTVKDGDIAIEGGRYRRLKVVSDQYWAGIELVAREQGEAGSPHIDFTHGDLDNPNFGIRVVGTANNTLSIQSGDGTANLDVQGNLSITGFTTGLGHSVNNAQNTGVGRGLRLWSATDSVHVIYSASPQGKSPADKTPVAGFFNAGHRMRFRTATGQGFLFENSDETALVDITSDSGNLWTKGAVYAGNSDLYFTRTDHNHSGIGNTVGYAAIENAANYEALMILGRQTASGRKVKLWDALEVNGTLRVTAGAMIHSIGIGTQDHGAISAPYESIQMNPAHNLRIWFGTKQRFVLENTGQFTIQFDSGRWVFQNDGNLVKYNNSNQAVWALNNVSGRAGW